MLLVALVLALAAPAWGAPAIDALNAQRAANGIPAGIVENPEWSAGCAAHMEYLELNGFTGDWHDETPGAPGYSEAGRAAARGSVLAAEPWAGPVNPWEDAPVHLAQLLAPALSVTGYADGCMWTWPGYLRPPPASLETYSYPGEDAVIYPAMTALEEPFVPGDFVDLPAGTRTGPHLYVFGFGAGTSGGRLLDVSVVGPSGAVDVRVVDNHTAGLGPYLPPGGIIIPVAPLRVDAGYTAQATFVSDAGGSAVRRWTFRTSALRRPSIAVGFDGSVVSASSTSSAPGTVTLMRDGQILGRWPLGGAVPFPAGAGRYEVCVDQESGGGFLAVRECAESVVAPAAAPAAPALRRPDVSLRVSRVRGGRARATVRARGAAVGRRVRVSMVRVRRGAKIRVRTVRLARRAVRFDVGVRPVRVVLTVPPARGYASLVLRRTQR